MVAVPSDTPVINPEAVMLATPGAPELHAPPAMLSVSVVVFVWQMSSAPKIVPAYGDGLMVTTAVA